MISTSSKQNQDSHSPVQSRWTVWDGSLACFLTLIGFIYFQYRSFLPLRVPTHFNIHGIADGWTSREHLGWLLLGLPSLLWLFMTGVSFLRSPHELSWQKDIRVTIGEKMRGVIPLGIGVMLSGTTLLSIFYDFSIPKFLFVVLGFIFMAIFLILYQANKMIPTEYRDHYRFGLIYNNPRDPSVWVPRIGGMGLTLNFAHKKAYAWLMLLLFVPFLIILFSQSKIY